jgi:site-specific DNA recombinase
MESVECTAGIKVGHGDRHHGRPECGGDPDAEAGVLRSSIDRGPAGPGVLARLATPPQPAADRTHGGIIIAEYFDCGHSRSLPWQRRPAASRLLEALRDPDRGFAGVVIGEPQRAFYGNQFSLTFPIFTHYGVQLWVPEVGGPVDPGSEAHDLVMTLFGGMSKGERTRIKTRVRAAMSAQTATEGRFLGGRPPYGYQLADAGEHPHPGKAAVGARLHRLEPDQATAEVVARIFELFLAGHGCYAIAEQLTAEGIPSPAGYDRVRNPHRPGRAWAKSAVRAILRNPRYTGYQVWGRQRRDEVLLDVDDVAAGHVSRMRWNDATNWVWSAQPTHQPLVDQTTFQAVQARIATRSPHSSRTPRATPRPYLLRGRLHCALCQRRLQGQWIRGEAYYRCRYPAEYAAASDFQHPKSLYLREVDLVGRLDDWLAELFNPANLDHTCQTLATASRSDPAGDQRRAAQQILADCQRRLERYRAALEAGTDPAVVQQWIAEVTATRATAEAQLRDSRTATDGLTPEQVRDLVEQAGGLVEALNWSDPALRAQLYEELGIDGVYDPDSHTVHVQVELGRRIGRVGGGT